VQECARRWRLELEEPFEYAFASLAIPAGGVVLKIQFPDREAEHEADALRVWDGEGAVRLLDHDPERHALLLERARPGTSLAGVGQDEALDVVADLLPRLWKHAGVPFRTVADEAAWWVDCLPEQWEQAGQPFERSLLDAATEALVELPVTQGELVLVHQDLHADNILRAEREPWLVIDPKPLLAEREFSLAPIVRGPELGHDRASVHHRLDRLSAALGLDRERARRWTIAQTIDWGLTDDGAIATHVDVARWLMEAARE
jgi:streptomycin 6-kinase